jgi:hypothetical protein
MEIVFLLLPIPIGLVHLQKRDDGLSGQKQNAPISPLINSSHNDMTQTIKLPEKQQSLPQTSQLLPFPLTENPTAGKSCKFSPLPALDVCYDQAPSYTD